MATINLSAGWVTAMVPRLFRLTDGLNFPYPYANDTTDGLNFQYSNAGLLNSGGSTGNAAIGGIYIMKGTMPTTTSAISTLGTVNADVLVKFLVGGSSAGDFVTTQDTVNPAVISTKYVNAVASGTATWFLWFTTQSVATLVDGHGVADTTKPLGHCIIGTIGVTGSGADLEMPSVSIVSGDQYRIMNLRLLFPDTWTY